MTLHYNHNCWACWHFRYHFHHDDGTKNEDPRTKAFPDCDLCLTGRIHLTHDKRAFNANRELGGR